MANSNEKFAATFQAQLDTIVGAALNVSDSDIITAVPDLTPRELYLCRILLSSIERVLSPNLHLLCTSVASVFKNMLDITSSHKDSILELRRDHDEMQKALNACIGSSDELIRRTELQASRIEGLRISMAQLHMTVPEVLERQLKDLEEIN